MLYIYINIYIQILKDEAIDRNRFVGEAAALTLTATGLGFRVQGLGFRL